MSEKTDNEFTINLLGVYIKELHARDLGGYPEERVGELNGKHE